MQQPMQPTEEMPYQMQQPTQWMKRTPYQMQQPMQPMPQAQPMQFFGVPCGWMQYMTVGLFSICPPSANEPTRTLPATAVAGRNGSILNDA